MIASEIAERREYLRRIVAVTSMLGRQGIPFRGNNEVTEEVSAKILQNASYKYPGG